MTRARNDAGMAAGKKASSAAAGSLTQHEGMILSVIVREQPVMAYQVYKIFERSPVTAINSSKTKTVAG